MKTTYENGVATITTNTRQTQINVPVTARLALDGHLDRISKSDLVAVSMAFLCMQAERDRLAEELKAARAGQIGKEHARDMQEARKVISDVRLAGAAFFEMYDRGDAPDSGLDDELRQKLGSAERWLLCDVNASFKRAKLLEGGEA